MTKVVGSATALTFSVEAATKLLPLTVRANAPLPATTVDGLNEVTVAAGGGGGGGAGVPEPPPAGTEGQQQSHDPRAAGRRERTRVKGRACWRIALHVSLRHP